MLHYIKNSSYFDFVFNLEFDFINLDNLYWKEEVMTYIESLKGNYNYFKNSSSKMKKTRSSSVLEKIEIINFIKKWKKNTWFMFSY